MRDRITFGRNESKEFANDLRLRRKSTSPLKETEGCECSEFHGFCDGFGGNKYRGQLDIGEELKA